MITFWVGATADAPPAAAEIAPSLEARYRARREEALRAVRNGIERSTFGDEAVEDLIGVLHKLAGSAGMFGEPELGAEAHALEEGLRDWPEEERAERMAQALQRMTEAAQRPAGSGAVQP